MRAGKLMDLWIDERLATLFGSASEAKKSGVVRSPGRSQHTAILYAGWFAMWTLFGLVLFGQDLALSQRASAAEDWRPLLLCWLTQAYAWALLSVVVRWLSRRLPIAGRRVWRGLAGHLPLSVLLALASVGLVDAVGLLLRIPWYQPDFRSVFMASLPIRLPLNMFTYWLLLGFWEVSRGHEKYRLQKQRALQSELQLSDLKTQLATAQLAALKNQLQPHFLFNSLNSIMALVRRQESAPAELMLERLGHLLRCMLRDSDAQEVTLGDELELIQLYLSIEQVRFQDRLQVEIDVRPELLRSRVPNMCLQPLVENAIRHGISKNSAAGKLLIRSARSGDSLKIEVHDTGSQGGAPSHRRSLGIGISNTRARLHSLYGDEGRVAVESCAGGGTLATVVIPFRTLAVNAVSRSVH
jgi:two-component system, LytTR family, sensor kinase